MSYPPMNYLRSGGTTPEYPYGSFKNETLADANDGTPLDNKWADDIQGFLQALLRQAEITPSGVPDTVLASDYFDSCASILVGNKFITIMEDSLISLTYPQVYVDASMNDIIITLPSPSTFVLSNSTRKITITRVDSASTSVTVIGASESSTLSATGRTSVTFASDGFTVHKIKEVLTAAETPQIVGLIDDTTYVTPKGLNDTRDIVEYDIDTGEIALLGGLKLKYMNNRVMTIRDGVTSFPWAGGAFPNKAVTAHVSRSSDPGSDDAGISMSSYTTAYARVFNGRNSPNTTCTVWGFGY